MDWLLIPRNTSEICQSSALTPIRCGTMASCALRCPSRPIRRQQVRVGRSPPRPCPFASDFFIAANTRVGPLLDQRIRNHLLMAGPAGSGPPAARFGRIPGELSRGPLPAPAPPPANSDGSRCQTIARFFRRRGTGFPGVWQWFDCPFPCLVTTGTAGDSGLTIAVHCGIARSDFHFVFLVS